MSDSLDVASAGDRDIKRRSKAVAVEPVEGGRGRAARPHLATDVEHQRMEFGDGTGRSTGQPIGVDTDLEEGTARDSVPKLCVGHANAVRLPP